MRHSWITEKRKIATILGVQFLVFFYIFGTYPPMGDRLFENFSVSSFENLWRYIDAQRHWFMIANGRVFSNLGTAFFDVLPLSVRGAVYSLLLVMCTILICVIVNKKLSSFRIACIFCLFCIVSQGIKKEVYYYATGLYISALFLLLLVGKVIIDTLEDNKDDWSFAPYTRNRKIAACAIAFFSSTWLENIGTGVFCIIWLIFIWKLIKKTSEIKTWFHYAVFSTLGYSILVASIIFNTLHARGRIIGGFSVSNIFQLYTLYNNLIIDNSALFFVFICVASYRVYRKKIIVTPRIKMLSGVLSITLIGCYGLNCLLNIYGVLSSSPISKTKVHSIEVLYGWNELRISFFDKFAVFTQGKIYCFLIVLLSAVWFAVVGYALFQEKDKKVARFVFSFFAVSTLCVSFPPLGWADPRVLSSSIFMLIVLIATIIYEPSNENKNATIIHTTIFVIVFFQFVNMHFDVVNAKKIEDSRTNRAEYVINLQATNQWDYEKDVLQFPKYTFDGADTRNNPSFEEYSYTYQFMLRHYGLNALTRIEYEEEN